MKQLKHVTFSMRPDHVELLNKISDRYGMRSRSAALSFALQEYVRMSYREMTTHAVYVDTDSVKVKDSYVSVDKTPCMYDHAAEILKAIEDDKKDFNDD
jgi:metal-responsive CopG/Arc/MetJ family transcriptional regulator